MDRLIDLLPLTLIILLFYKAKPVKALRGFNENYLDIVPCRSVRGFYALVIMFHHLSQQTESGSLFRVFLYLGYTVSVFFFLSGYGLMKKLTTDSGYRKGFLRKHLPQLLLPLLFVFLVFKLLYALNGEQLSLACFLFLVVNGDIIMCIFWYMITLFLFYFAFGVLLLVFKTSKQAVLVGMTVFCLLYTGLGIQLGFGQWWYMSSHLLVVGMAWALYEDRILSFCKKGYWPCLLLFSFAFLFLWQFFDQIYALRPAPGTRLGILMVRNFVFTLAFVLFTMKVKLGNPILDQLGRVSLELYMLHPVFLFLFHSRFIYIESDFLYCLAVIAATIISARIFSDPYKALCKKYRRLIS